MDLRCERTDLLVDDCAHCRVAGLGVAARKTADYSTTCTGCGGAISVGDRIGNVNGNWVCPPCTREAQ